MKANNAKKVYGESPLPYYSTICSLGVSIKFHSIDGKKSCWVPDKATGGYLEGLCENDMKVAKKNETTEMKMLKRYHHIGGQE